MDEIYLNVGNRLGWAPRVLVAEDSRVNQKIALVTLEAMGCRPEIVVNGREALQHLQQNEYDLILMDCQMPEIDGYETTRQIRASAQPYKNVPIVAMTANTVVGHREQCLAAGMNDYVEKPIDLQDLARAILSVLTRVKR